MAQDDLELPVPSWCCAYRHELPSLVYMIWRISLEPHAWWASTLPTEQHPQPEAVVFNRFLKTKPSSLTFHKL